MRGRGPFHDHPVSGQYEWPYRRRDAEAWAAYYGVPYREPERLRVAPGQLAEACIAAGRLGCLVPYSPRLFAAIFVAGLVVDAGVLAGLAEQGGTKMSALRTIRPD